MNLPYKEIGTRLAGDMARATGMMQVQVLPTDSRRWPAPPLEFKVEPLFGHDFNVVPRVQYDHSAFGITPGDVVTAWDSLIDIVSAANIRSNLVRATLSRVFPRFPFPTGHPFDCLAQFLYLARDVCGHWQYDGQTIQIGGHDGIARCYLSRRSIGCGPRHRVVGAMAEQSRHILAPIYMPVGDGRSAGRGVVAIQRRLRQVFPLLDDQIEALIICAVFENAEAELTSCFDLRQNHNALNTVTEVPQAFEQARRRVLDAKAMPNADVIELLSPYFNKRQVAAHFRGNRHGVYTAELRSRYLRNLAALELEFRQANGLLSEAERATEALKKKGLVVS